MLGRCRGSALKGDCACDCPCDCACVEVVQTRWCRGQRWCRSGCAVMQRCSCRGADLQRCRFAEVQRCSCGGEDVLRRCRGSAEEVIVQVIVQV